MCGFAGVLGDWRGAGDLELVARRMADRVRHRGPDDAGVWVDPNAGIALGHQRLSVVDLSAQGRQPMVSPCGRFVLVFNGEIYNHLEIRKVLLAEQDVSWRGYSDSETLLVACARWGVERALQQSVGMFALALWDRRERVLTLGRDRLGEKPLYYGWQGGALLFGSELKALRAHPSFKAAVDRNALSSLLRFNHVPDPHTIYQGVFKLIPGATLRVTTDGSVTEAPRTYWSARSVAEIGQSQSFPGTYREAVDELERQLKAAVRGQMIADVPLGAFLSGGIDSSTVVSLMQAQSSRQVRTFSAGFWDNRYNEAEEARRIAAHLGTQHTEIFISEHEALSVVPQLTEIYDEPFADSSQIPTYLVSRIARQAVTVSLSGDGGDEVFGGYNRYLWAPQVWRSVKSIPGPMRKSASALLMAVSPAAWTRVFDIAQRLVPASRRYRNVGDKLHKVAEILSKPNLAMVYLDLLSQWKQPDDVVLGSVEPASIAADPSMWPDLVDIEHQMMWLDLTGYLPGDVLVKLDRSAMRLSLETRAPFLDHRVVEFAWRLPLTMKIRDRVGKCVLRDVLARYVPTALFERPKMGFGVPLDAWLRGPLRDWAETLIDDSRLRREGYLRPEPIRMKWQEHQRGTRNWAHQLWNVLIFQAWLESSAA